MPTRVSCLAHARRTRWSPLQAESPLATRQDWQCFPPEPSTSFARHCLALHHDTLPPTRAPDCSVIMAAGHLSPTSTSSLLSRLASQGDEPAHVHGTPSASPPISTPPTSLGDAASVLSETSKTDPSVDAHDEAPAAPTVPATESRRPARSSRKSVTTYNVQILAGTAIHTPTKYLEKHHKNVVHGDLSAVIKNDTATPPPKKKTQRRKSEAAATSDPAGEQLAAEAAQAARRRTSARGTDLRKEALRNLAGAGDASADTSSRSRTLAHKTLRRTASDSHLLSATATALSKQEDGYDSGETQEHKQYLKPKTKVWMKQGLYVGQHRDFDPRLSESQNRAKKRAKKTAENRVLPLPLFAGDRLLSEDPRENYRDFKLPFDTYSPLPKKVKVDGWVKLHRSEAYFPNHHDQVLICHRSFHR